MAKRRSHYRSRGYGRGRGRGRGRGPGRGRGRENENDKRHKNWAIGEPPSLKISDDGNSWMNSSLPLGIDDDIHLPEHHVSPEDVAAFYFNQQFDPKSMRSLGQRQTTSLDASDKPHRKRPVEFIRAKQVYDPSKDIILQLSHKNAISKVPTETASSDSDPSDRNSQDSTFNSSFYSPKPSEELYFVDECGEHPREDAKVKMRRTIYVDEPENVQPANCSTKNHIFDPIMTIGKTEIKLEEDDNEVLVKTPNTRYHPFRQNKVSTELYQKQKSQGLKVIEQQPIPNFNEASSDSSSRNVTSSTSNVLDISKTKPPPQVHSVLRVDREHAKDEIVNIEQLEQRPMVEALIPAGPYNDKAHNQLTMIDNTEVNDMNKSTEVEPEFGFKEEDYIVDISEITVTNLRFGASENMYFTCSYRLFGNHEPQWISQDVLTDFVTDELGLPHNRLGAYLKYIHDSIMITDEDLKEEKCFALPIPDDTDETGDDMNGIGEFSSGESSIDYDSRDDLGENLEDLIWYSQKYSGDRNREYDPGTTRTVGKGKKKKLLVSEELGLDQEMLDTLQDKLTNRLLNKAKKRRSKEDFVDKENIDSSDLFLKYPVGLHVQNIKDEFDNFGKSNLERLIFPPLDPHGNKTVRKFAEYYNLKSSSLGHANRKHIMVEKTKIFKRSKPFQAKVSNLLRQRPIFMRIDVRTAQSKDSKTTKRERIDSKGKFHLKEGEIVGENAPAIGSENIGRKMLEKLGWSSGEGLGAHGNKGISEPLTSVVKKSKSGLKHSSD